MRVAIQRVSSAAVEIHGVVIGQIDRGLLIFVGIESSDDADDGEWLAQKIARLRIFSDETDQMNRSIVDVAGGVLVVSQFTLHASVQRGTRPSFNRAAQSDYAEPLYNYFIAKLTAALGRPVVTGAFGANMQVKLVNDGPVTLVLDSKLRE